MKLKTLLAALLLAGFAINTKAQTTDEDLDAKYATSLIQPGTVAPDFTMNTPDGKPFSLSSLKGKTVVLDFWASWCPDCRKDAPEVVRLYNDFHSDKVEFVGVSMDTNVEAWQKAINQYGISYPQVSELKKFKETDISKSYGVQWIPSMVVVSPEGNILLSTVQYQKVEKLLKGINK
ncbi:hypothetical protein PRMUPPPA20_04130 [Xylanibacter ruminicola]|uniref:Thiol-disulfide oxidoreductase n=2 Tax=Xylanibacter ruminicola TaxID=839 RepID=D5EYP4_XYLR2|nr:TlpA disulfide reductase family protein [Xylanibacter ruminicola]ADE82030.1 putative thiol-disulfide oxidoreductase [Xylanibacter ruminicola 23]GJG32304.1 hypothetical protein PRMUPPPA20_04130 [Xylanibacter ruminicola]SEH81950.1 Peroxiredoxin [Xylanibacter ruminicola]